MEELEQGYRKYLKENGGRVPQTALWVLPEAPTQEHQRALMCADLVVMEDEFLQKGVALGKELWEVMQMEETLVLNTERTVYEYMSLFDTGYRKLFMLIKEAKTDCVIVKYSIPFRIGLEMRYWDQSVWPTFYMEVMREVVPCFERFLSASRSDMSGVL